MHSRIDELAAQSEAAFRSALDAVAAHSADLGLEPIGELTRIEVELFNELDEVLKVDIATLPPPTAAPTTPPTLAPAPSASKSRRTTIRIPSQVLKKYQDRARLTGSRYQTVIIKTLKAAASDW